MSPVKSKGEGNAIRQLFRIESSALNAEEARYLIGVRDVDTIRNRAITAISGRRQRLLSKGIHLERDAQHRITAWYLPLMDNS